jgi:hypothetical protein
MNRYYFEYYKNLSWGELAAIGYYCIGDNTLMDDFLIKEPNFYDDDTQMEDWTIVISMSKDMGRFLADVLTKRMKLIPKKNGRPLTPTRDYQIWRAFEAYNFNLQLGISPLTEAKARYEAADKVASEFFISADAVLKIIENARKDNDLNEHLGLLEFLSEKGFQVGEMNHDL